MKARVLTPYLIAEHSGDVHCLSFWYMLYGDNIGTLNVYLVSLGEFRTFAGLSASREVLTLRE